MAPRVKVAVPKEGVDLKGVRSFIYRIDLDSLEARPIMEFSGKWSRHAVDMMLKHALKGLRQYKRELLKEGLNGIGRSEEPRDEAA
jgi:hypothetical protein